jgi:uncharacterized cofD-like protein
MNSRRFQPLFVAIVHADVAHGLRMSNRMQSASAFAPIRVPTTISQRNARQLTAVPKRTPRIVALGGGTGLPSVLEGLCELSDEDGAVGCDHISAVVTVTDEGGSSGRLRRDFGVLPPGDVRNCLAAVAPPDSPFKRLMQHRFAEGEGLEGHAIGNLILTALSQITGDFASAVEQMGSMMGLRGRVLPTTRENVRLRAELDSGEIRDGETHITGSGSRIRRLSLNPSPKPLPEVLRALVNADGIVVGPGSLYTSLLPNLLVEGVAATMSGVDAVRIYVANLMTEPGETDGFSLDDHLHAIRLHAGYDLFDYIVVHKGQLASEAAARYAEQGSTPVALDVQLKWAGRARIVECDLAAHCDGRKIRHSAAPLARVIRELVVTGRRT